MLSLPSLRFAHEVYVLSPQEVAADKHRHIDFFAPLHSGHDVRIIILYTLILLAVIGFFVWLKTKRPIQKLGALIDKAGLWAPDLIRVVFGLSLVFSALHNALYGPELPLSSFPHGQLLRPILFILGGGIVAGIFTRLLSLLSIVIFVFAFWDKGWYMLTYTNYLGEALALILVTYQSFSLDRLRHRGGKKDSARFTIPELALPATRTLFGFALLFTAFNIKVASPAVSLDVVERYHLTKFFHFDPMMVVLGATLVELLIALFFIIGFMQRINSLVFITFIGLSLAYFKEAVWPHYLLFALAIGIFLDRPDSYTVDRWLADKFHG